MLSKVGRRAVHFRPTAVRRNMSKEKEVFEGRASKKMWGGRFAKDTDPRLKEWTESVSIDRHIVREDLWVIMLGHQEVIPHTDAAGILKSLQRIHSEFDSGKWDIGYEQEDVHMNVEATVIKEIGMDVGGRMHTTRSRNDQVVLDSKLYARRKLLELREKTVKAIEALLARSEKYVETVAVGYTHVQHAQPISVAYWLSHYASGLMRDLRRLKNAYDTVDENPLGAGAISGTSFNIDRHLTSDLLGFQRVHVHGLDATSARDFLLETSSAIATLYSTLSRMGEEFVLWSSYEFRTLSLDDGFAMGSSMMPQKKNPGALELLRGRSGRINGLMLASYDMLKGLPSGYNRDFHEDKEILVATFDIVNRAVGVVPDLINTTTIQTQRMEELIASNFATATELANFLVSKHKVPFRQAHHIVGSLVGNLHRAGKSFHNNLPLCMEHLKKEGVTSATEKEVAAVLDPKTVMLSYNSLGGTGGQAVRAMLADMQAELKRLDRQVKTDQERVAAARKATGEIVAQLASQRPANIKDYHKVVAQLRPKSLAKL